MNERSVMGSPKVSRRRFLEAAGAGFAVTGAAGATILTHSEAHAQEWAHEVDIIVVGSGGAAGAAMATAHSLGNSVIVIEKAPIWGGTTQKSGGGTWVPNNRFMRENGVPDIRDDALRYMARTAYPENYDPNDDRLGLSEHEYSLITAFYDEGSGAFEYLEKIKAQTFQWRGVESFADYYSDLPEDKAPYGRGMFPRKPDGTRGAGAEMARQFKAYATENGIPVLLEHRVTGVIQNAGRDVIGVVAKSTGEGSLKLRAKKAVIFGTGGFTQNSEMCRNFLRGPIFGGCAVPTNEGDFVNIGIAAGAAIGNMANAFWGEVVLESALQNTSVPTLIWVPLGDGMIQINKYGVRYVDEKMVYPERTQAHFAWDPHLTEFPNLVTFTIYDQRTADEFAGVDELYPVKGTIAPHVVSGRDLAELAANIDARLQNLSNKIGGLRLDPDFLNNLTNTIARYNEFAMKGVDEDFHRGELKRGVQFHQDGGGAKARRLLSLPNPTMYPLSKEGPYYAVLVAAGTLDTTGGPKINAKAQILDTSGHVIKGLYGAGNCIAAPSAKAYWSGGATLGPALVFGHLAGINANLEEVKV